MIDLHKQKIGKVIDVICFVFWGRPAPPHLPAHTNKQDKPNRPNKLKNNPSIHQSIDQSINQSVNQMNNETNNETQKQNKQTNKQNKQTKQNKTKQTNKRPDETKQHTQSGTSLQVTSTASTK